MSHSQQTPIETREVAGYRGFTDEEVDEMTDRLNNAIHECVYAAAHIAHDDHQDAVACLFSIATIANSMWIEIEAMAIHVENNKEEG